MEPHEASLPLRLICSDELGLLKVIQTPDGTRLDGASVVASWGQPDKSRAVSCLHLSGSGPECAVLATARATGGVDVLNPCTGDALASLPAPSCPAAGNNGDNGSSLAAAAAVVQGLHWLWGTQPAGAAAAGGTCTAGSPLPSLLSVTQGGCARIYGASTAQQAAGTAGSPAWEELQSWQVPANVCCTAYDPGSNLLAVGCEGAELRLFDVAQGQLTYSAKGGKPNKLGLVDRPWNTALSFLPASCRPTPSGDGGGSNGNGSAAGSGSVVLAGTGYHKLRLYDTRAGKRPQADVAFGEARITALAPESDGLRCWVGTGLGQLEVLDLRAMKMAGGVRGIAGSIRSLALHPDRPILASVGLDRFLRLHDTRTRAPLGKVYLKQQITVLPSISGDGAWGAAAGGAARGEGAAEGGGDEEGEDERRRRKKERKEKRKKEGAGKEGRERRAKKDRAVVEA